MEVQQQISTTEVFILIKPDPALMDEIKGNSCLSGEKNAELIMELHGFSSLRSKNMEEILHDANLLIEIKGYPQHFEDFFEEVGGHVEMLALRLAMYG